MKSEPSATTMTNETFTRWQSVCGSHLPYVTPSAGCGLPLFRLSGKLFKTEISYKRRERAQSIFSRTSRPITVRCHVPAESGGKLTSPVRTCARGRRHWTAASVGSSGYLSGSQRGAPTTLTMWGSGASREHVPIPPNNLLVLSFWKSSLTCLYLSTLCLRNEWQRQLPQRTVGRVQKKNHRVSRTVLINGSHHKKSLLRECPEQGILTISWETYRFLGCGW